MFCKKSDYFILNYNLAFGCKNAQKWTVYKKIGGTRKPGSFILKPRLESDSGFSKKSDFTPSLLQQKRCTLIFSTSIDRVAAFDLQKKNLQPPLT